MALNYYRSDGWVKAVQGQAISGAQIYVCTQPANVTPPVTPPRTQPVPWQGPNPQALIYSDAGITPITQPVITDGFGHYDFYTLPGLYTVVVMFNGKVQQVYIDQSVGNVSTSGSGSGLSLETNSTPNVNQALLNLIEGAGITVVTDNLGNTTITNTNPTPTSPISLKVNSTPNASQTILNFEDTATVTWSDLGGGVVKASATASAGLSLPSIANFRLWTAVDFGGIWNSLGDSLTSSDGGVTDTLIAASATNGIARKFSASGTQTRVYQGSNFAYVSGRGTTYSTICTLDYDVVGSGGVFAVGLTDIAASGAADPTSGNFVGFYSDKSNGSPYGNWTFISSVGGSSVSVGTGVAIVPGARTKLEFSISAVGVVTCKVNGTISGTGSPALPTVAMHICMYFHSHSFAGTIEDIVEYMYASNDTP